MVEEIGISHDRIAWIHLARADLVPAAAVYDLSTIENDTMSPVW